MFINRAPQGTSSGRERDFMTSILSRPTRGVEGGPSQISKILPAASPEVPENGVPQSSCFPKMAPSRSPATADRSVSKNSYEQTRYHIGYLSRGANIFQNCPKGQKYTENMKNEPESNIPLFLKGSSFLHMGVGIPTN